MKSKVKEKKRSRRSTAGSQYPDCVLMAWQHRFVLRKCTSTHYQLIHPNKAWIINIYPGNMHIYVDKHNSTHFKPQLPKEWDLTTAVKILCEQALQNGDGYALSN